MTYNESTMTDAWLTHVTNQRIKLENVNKFWCPDMTGLEDFKDKTLIWYNPVDHMYHKTDLRDMVWSLEYGCNTSPEYAYVEEQSLSFVGIPSSMLRNYAYRRHMALFIKKYSFDGNIDILKSAFLGYPFGTVIPHPFAKISVPLANLSYMVVIDKDFDEASEAECDKAVQELKNKFKQISTDEFFLAARLAANCLPDLNDPFTLDELTINNPKWKSRAEIL